MRAKYEWVIAAALSVIGAGGCAVDETSDGTTGAVDEARDDQGPAEELAVDQTSGGQGTTQELPPAIGSGLSTGGGSVAIAAADDPPGSLEILIDRCSGSVVVEDTSTMGSIIMFRNFTPDVNQPYSGPIAVSNPRLTWFCFDSHTSLTGSRSTEHSTCPGGTHHLRARLGPNRLLNMACLP